MQILPRSQLRDRAALEAVTGKTPDISEFCDFDFYGLVWYHAEVHPGIGQQNREVGRWLGVSEHVGNDMCYWILGNNGMVVLEEGHAMGGISVMVTRRMTDKNGRPIGKAHSNPMLDTRVYEVQLEDGTHEHLMANKIAEN
ncbi:hypothetical protein ACHAWF_007584, partial [Thalassiosira exigua]